MGSNELRYLASNMLPGPLHLIGGKGVVVIGDDGKNYYDLTSQTLNLNLGHGHPVIINAVKELLNSDNFTYYISPRFYNPKSVELAKKLIASAPRDLSRVNLHLCNGSDANEDGIKRARKYHANKGKRTIISLRKSYLGSSAETISASGGNIWKEDSITGSNNYVFIEPIDTYRRPSGMSIEELSARHINLIERTITSRGDVAGLILEPIPFNAGVLIPPKSYLKGIEQICDKHDVMLIADEIQTGFGWCGKMYASSYFDISPGSMSLAKGLTAGFPALAASMFKEKYDVLKPGTSEFTFGAQSIPIVAALANVDFLNNSGILDSINEKHNLVMRHLNEIKDQFNCVGDVRGLGLIFGIEFDTPQKKPDYITPITVFNSARENGVLVNIPTLTPGHHSAISIKPPITITLDEIDDSMNLLSKSFKDCKKRGLLK